MLQKLEREIYPHDVLEGNEYWMGLVHYEFFRGDPSIAKKINNTTRCQIRNFLLQVPAEWKIYFINLKSPQPIKMTCEFRDFETTNIVATGDSEVIKMFDLQDKLEQINNHNKKHHWTFNARLKYIIVGCEEGRFKNTMILPTYYVKEKA